jgi:hypothetical protein
VSKLKVSGVIQNAGAGGGAALAAGMALRIIADTTIITAVLLALSSILSSPF